MCRAPWKNEPLLKHLNVDESLDAEAVQIYLNWMYSSTIRIPATFSPNSDAFNIMLLKCWMVALAVQDTAFRNAVIYTYFTEAGAIFGGRSVAWAFVQDNANMEIKDFVMEVFMTSVKPGWFKMNGGKWPDVFVRSLADRILEGGKRKNYHAIREAWLERLEVEDEEIEEGGGGSAKGKTAQQNGKVIVLDNDDGARDPVVGKYTWALRDRRSMGLQPGSLKDTSFDLYETDD